MVKKKPQLGLTDQLIAAKKQYRKAAKVELEELQNSCIDVLTVAIEAASQNITERNNAARDGGKLIKVLEWIGVPGYVARDVTGPTTDAVDFLHEWVDYAAWPISERGEYMLVPEDSELVMEYFDTPRMYTHVPNRTIVEALVTKRTIAKVRQGKGKFYKLLEELELLSCPDHK